MKFISKNHLLLSPFFERLSKLFSKMDEQYRLASDSYGFHCKGCNENCCMTRFFHHTYLEYFYILEGIGAIEEEIRASLQTRAENAYQKTMASEQDGKTVRYMCPLNLEGLCLIYRYRPMICRMHGIPHELRYPGRPVAYGPGCDDFSVQCEGKKYFQFDRTPLYVEMSNLEKEMKEKLGITGKFKKTIAQMLVEKNEID